MKKIALVLLSILLLQGASFAVFNKTVTFPGKKMAPVVFSHEKHLSSEGINCKTCHTAIFKQKAGASKVTMAGINKGKFCGVCHKEKGKAFAVANNCARCHVKTEG